MKTLFITLVTILFVCLLFFVQFRDIPVGNTHIGELVERDGIFYKKFTDVPFTGRVDKGPTKGVFKNGEREGSWVWYYDNGQMRFKGDFRNGKKEGPWIYFYGKGQIDKKGDYKNDNKEGPWMSYTRDGSIVKEETGIYKNGEKISD